MTMEADAEFHPCISLMSPRRVCQAKQLLPNHVTGDRTARRTGRWNPLSYSKAFLARFFVVPTSDLRFSVLGAYN
jgi:hypothetical protein